jgi:type I restriction-modification system DNA methylase subunit
MPTKAEGKKILKELVNKFKRNNIEYKNSTYNETQVRIDFINPLLEAIGWDLFNTRGLSQYLREVIQEDTVDVDDEGVIAKKKPDYALCLNGKRKMFVEVKKPSVHIESLADPAFQVRRYGWNAKLPISILTNFDKFIVYDCRYRPTYGDDVRIARMHVYSFEDLIDKFDEIYDCFSAENVFSGHFDEIFTVEEERAGTEPFDSYFLKQIEDWRLHIAENLLGNNVKLKQDELNFLIQRLINRVVFLRICEDRELEKYKGLLEIQSYNELKVMFKRADERYNSGLFDFLDDELSLNIQLDDDLIIRMFRELYYPESPYAFTVVESGVLGEIYEQFLAREVKLKDGRIEVSEKPEVIESQGVVTTPRFIVDSIINKTLVPKCLRKAPTDIETLKIADIACGSGIFLLAAYDYLLSYHLEWYINNTPSNYPNEVYQDGQGQWKLTLYEKQRILKNNIYGVDIDIQAVEVTRFSLLLKVLENETVGSIDSQISKHDITALPSLDNNIQCGNSLVDYSFFDFTGDEADIENQLVNINPLNWETSFESVFLNGGFDVIIGNPPYIRIQNMVKYSPLEYSYYKSELAPFKCANSSNFDKYILFIERSLTLLKEGGYLGIIVPHKFFTLKSGNELRKLISQGKYLNEIVHFGVEQVFKGKLTYTSILKLIKSTNESFTVEHVSRLKSWVYGDNGYIETFPFNEISEEPWIFLHPDVKNLFDKIKSSTNLVIKDVADVFVGIQTSADPIYIIHPEVISDEDIQFIDKDGIHRSIEKGILHPFFHDVRFEAFGKPKSNAYVIFPYKEYTGRSAVMYTPQEMELNFPNCWEYLNQYKEALLKRSVIPPFTEQAWYKYGRSQSLTKFNGKSKLVWTTLSLESRYVYDNEDIVFSGGGNGPYYGLRIKVGNQHSIFYIQAILCHPVIEAMVKTGKTSKFQGGYYSHGKQFIDILPFRNIDFNNEEEVKVHNQIVTLVQRLIDKTQEKNSATTPHTRTLSERSCIRLKRQIDKFINNLYGIDDKTVTIIEELT